ncbi:hypothetical protein FDI85_gp173 [Erwinia phage Machina]|uniref:Uncharacterized protein n=1 Tax=Erwinia phage Machina TaxID=1883375 RepID=A0A1B2IES3_9CAUD|nr:hypothetical protein FDI85_gp173 [Erwinia phage Machina]ANZ49749.1 hypothetical protein MACHINA_111 [Erwinia phage Machina]
MNAAKKVKLYELVSDTVTGIKLKVIHDTQTGTLYVRLTKDAVDEPGKYYILESEMGSAFGLNPESVIKHAFDLIRTCESKIFFRDIVGDDECLELYISNQHDKLAERLSNWGFMMEFYRKFSRDIMKDEWTHPSQRGLFSVKYADGQRVKLDNEWLFVSTLRRFNRKAKNGGCVHVSATIHYAMSEPKENSKPINGNINISRLYGRKDLLRAQDIVLEERNAPIIRAWLASPCDPEEILQGFSE